MGDIVEKLIFLIDDDSVDREFFTVMFQLYGYNTKQAASPEQAVRMLSDGLCPDLIFIDRHLDKNLENYDAIALLKKIRELESIRREKTLGRGTIPIVMLVEENDIEDRVSGYEQGVDDYINKPYNFLEILTKVRMLFQGQELTDQVVSRERRLALVESLNGSLIYFSQHLRVPMLDLATKAKLILQSLEDGSGASSNTELTEFVKKVHEQAENTIMTLDGLEDEVVELTEKKEQMLRTEITSEMLEEKYREHVKQHREMLAHMQPTGAESEPPSSD